MTKLSRYSGFVSAISALTHGRAVDLTGTTERVGGVDGYTLVGLNSSGFKPQKYGSFEEAPLATKDPNSKENLCIDLPAQSAGDRARFKTQSIDTFASLIKDSGPYLVFTHVPDLPDPEPNRTKNNSQPCNYKSTWLLTADARTNWINTLNSGKIIGIFAGHFHSPDLSRYGGPQFPYPSVPPPAPPVKADTVPIFVAPPLAVKFQWPTYPHGTRGMMFVTVNRGAISAQTDFYTPGTTLETFNDEGDSLRKRIVGSFSTPPSSAFGLAAILTFILFFSSCCSHPVSSIPTPQNRPSYESV